MNGSDRTDRMLGENEAMACTMKFKLIIGTRIKYIVEIRDGQLA